MFLIIGSNFIEVKDAEVRLSIFRDSSMYSSRKCPRSGKYPAKSCLPAGRALFSNQAKQCLLGIHLTILIEMRLQSARGQGNLYSSCLDHKNVKK